MDAKQLRHLMPKDSEDYEAARELTAVGPEELAPVIPEMLRRLKHHNSPVAEEFCRFFATQGEGYVQAVIAVLARSTMPEVKQVLLAKVLPAWSRDGVAECAGVLTMIASNPSFMDDDLLAMRLLARHQLADATWLRQWLEFKLARLAKRSQMAQVVEAELQRSTE